MRTSTPKKSGWSGYQWAIVLMLLAGLVVSAIDRVNIAIAGSYWVKHHMMTPGHLGLVQSIFSWTLTACLLLAGPVIDRLHPRRILPFGMLIWAIATWLTTVTLKLPLLSFARGLLGLGESALLPSAPKLIVENIGPKDRSKAISIYFTGNKLGPMIGLPLAAALLVSLGWRQVFYVTGAFSLVWVVLWFAIYRKNKSIEQPTMPASMPRHVGWGRLFAYRNTWALIIGQFGYLYVLYVFLTWVPGILVLQEHLSIGKSGSLSALPFVVGIVTTILGGWWADAWVNRGGDKTIVRKVIISGGLILSTIFVIIAAYGKTPAMAVLFLVLTMASMGLVTGSVNSLPMDLAPEETVSSVSSLQNFGGNLGASFAPLITGLLYGSLHNFHVALIVTGIVALFGACAYLFLLGKVRPSYTVSSSPVEGPHNTAVH